MAEVTNELIFETLKKVQSEVSDIRTRQSDHTGRFGAIDRRLDEVHETMYATAGYAVHSNIRHDTVAEKLHEIEERLAKLEENA